MPNFLSSLSDSPDESTPDQQIPSWMYAADNHNIGNSLGSSLLDPATWKDTAYNAYKMVATGMLSGANSFYNTGVSVGRFIGATDSDYNKTDSWIASIDDDLGKYYTKNRDAADMLGFIATSLLPGLAGIKILNAGQRALTLAADSGYLGSNLSKATGLVVPRTAMYVDAAANDLTQSMAQFSMLNANGVKALASGVHQGVLEGIAFETAVQTTMFKSPTLENQDTGDIIKNIAMGGLFNGAIGGALEAVSIRSTLKSKMADFQASMLPNSSRTLMAEGMSPSAKIILNADDLANAIKTDDGAVANSLFKDKQRRIYNDIRDSINTLSGTDSELGNLVADMQFGSTAEDTLNTFLHGTQLARLSKTTKVEQQIKDLAKEGQIDPSLGVNYIKLIGEDAGTVSTSAPPILGLADSVIPRANQSTQEAVLSEVRSYKFKTTDGYSSLNLKGQSAHQEAEARYIWASDILQKLPDDMSIHFTDFPLLQRALADSKLDINLVDEAGGVLKKGFSSPKELQDYIIEAKQDTAQKLISGPKPPDTQVVARILDTKVGRIDGDNIGDEVKDFFARSDATNQLYKTRVQKGLARDSDPQIDSAFIPNWAKMAYSVPEDVNSHVLDGLAYLKGQQKLIQNAADNVVAKWAPDYHDKIPTITQDDLMAANATGNGAGIISFENGNYGSLDSKMAGMGQITKQLSVDFRQNTQDALEGALAKLGQNQDAAIEHSIINQKITRSGELWILDPESRSLVVRDEFDKAAKASADGKDYDIDPSNIIPIKNEETFNVLNAELSRSGERIGATTEINSVYGRQTNRDPRVYQPIRPNLKDYPYFAFVKDDKVTGSGHTTLLHASSASKLDELVNSVKMKSPDLRVITKTETEDYFKATREYEYDRALNENYINSNLKNKGIFSEYYTKTDPQKIVNDILQQHLRQDDILATELVRMKNQPAFSWLEDQGKQFTKIEASKFGSSLSRIEKEGKNPYTDYIKTALNVSKASEYPLLYSINRTLDSAVSGVMEKIRDYSARAKSPEDMEGINTILQNYGMDSAYRNAATDLLVNHTAPKGDLSKFIRAANGMLSKLTLGLDPLNALNNFIGANVLRGTELNQVTRAIQEANPQLVGKLAGLTKVTLPGVGDTITSPSKLTAQAIKNFMQDDGTLLKQYQTAGYIKDITAQFKSMIDDFTLQGTESVSQLKGRLKSAFDKAQVLSQKGEKLTGNKFTEEFNRFISADVMRQITDVGVEAGVLSKEEAHSYINTFVNRVEGNTLASQRPIIFQGPIGQAIGLFQSYQFNLMQQMFRYVAEGSKKDAAMLLGLQSTFYGLQGLPAFQFINQHIVGTASGNKNHTDLYDAAMGIGGKQAGELLLYGLPSNILQTNIYSRGDINPRQLTVLPNSPAEIPFIGAFSKFLGSIYDATTKITNGAPVWESILQGIEHNGLSRPLAGIAQSLQAFGSNGQVYSTTSKGSILSSNDLFSIATAARIAGGRPLNEAVVNDAVYRIHSYAAYDKNKMDELAGAVKASVIAGNSPDPEDIKQFAVHYATNGGNQVNFNKWFMNEYKKANTPESQRIAAQLTNPLAQKAQLLMND